MQCIKIRDIPSCEGKTVSIRGFIQTIRDQNKIVFIVLRDSSGTVQCVVLNDNSDLLVKSRDITLESVVEITGMVKNEKQAPSGFEILVEAITVLSPAEPSLPIPVISKGEEGDVNQNSRFDHRWLDLRNPDKLRIFKVWTEVEKGIRDYFYENEWLQIYSPSFMATPSESGAEVFEIDYFDKKAYLAQSPQFYKQMAIASGFEKVFMAGPVFRAEHSFTSRHLTEFTGWDFEIAYIESHQDLMNIEEDMLISGFKKVQERIPEVEIMVPTKPFPRISMVNAKKKLAIAGVPSGEDHDLSPEEERSLSEIIKKETGHDFVFVTDYHISKRPFYHMRHEVYPTLTKSADLLYRGIEITTLAQREHRPDVLIAQAKEKGMSLENLIDYINFFRYGCPPHGGGGIGPARLVMKMLGLSNVREATFLPRDVNRLTP